MTNRAPIGARGFCVKYVFFVSELPHVRKICRKAVKNALFI